VGLWVLGWYFVVWVGFWGLGFYRFWGVGVCGFWILWGLGGVWFELYGIGLLVCGV